MITDNKNSIQCPNCKHEFDISNVLHKQIEERYAKDYAQKIKEIAEKQKIETEKLLTIERKRLSENFQKEFDESLSTLEKDLSEKSKQLSEARKEQAELIKLRQEVESQKANQEFEIEKAKNEIRKIEKDNFQKEFTEKFLLKEEEFNRKLEEKRVETEELHSRAINAEKKKVQKEFELALQNKELEFRTKLEENDYEKKVLERKLKDTVEVERLNLKREYDEIIRKKEMESDLRVEQEKIKCEQIAKKLEEAQKSAAQGSMQRQGEAQERVLLDRLKERFPQDLYKESRPGQPESDITQTIRNESGMECGTILYESKNTKAFSKDWLDKLKKDGFTAKADVLVLVTKAMPDYNKELHLQDGIWICPISAFEIVAMTLRSGLIMTFQAGISQQNKTEKMAMLYDFMVGNEFKHYLSAMVEGITNVKKGYEKEKLQLQKIWKQREKEFDAIIISATEFYGAIRGIAGDSVPQIPVLELTATKENDFQTNLLDDDEEN